MAKSNVLNKKIVPTAKKISDLADVILKGTGNAEYEVDKLVFTSKINNNIEITCKWVKRNGKWVWECN